MLEGDNKFAMSVTHLVSWSDQVSWSVSNECLSSIHVEMYHENKRNSHILTMFKEGKCLIID